MDQPDIVLVIDEVDLATRTAHCFDKTQSRIMASFREMNGASFLVPSQGEQWLAERRGWIWYLTSRLERTVTHQWISENMAAGDARVAAPGTLHLQATSIQVNEHPLGATARDVFTSGSSFASVTLTYTPITSSELVFNNGVLMIPTVYSISGKTITFSPSATLGNVLVSYQTSESP